MSLQVVHVTYNCKPTTFVNSFVVATITCNYKVIDVKSSPMQQNSWCHARNWVNDLLTTA